MLLCDWILSHWNALTHDTGVTLQLAWLQQWQSGWIGTTMLTGLVYQLGSGWLKQWVTLQVELMRHLQGTWQRSAKFEVQQVGIFFHHYRCEWLGDLCSCKALSFPLVCAYTLSQKTTVSNGWQSNSKNFRYCIDLFTLSHCVRRRKLSVYCL